MDTPHSFRLCAADTTDDERDGLVARGFVFKGERGTTLLFESLCEPKVSDGYGECVYTYPAGVRIRIVRAACMCSEFHKEPYPGEFDYSQVALDGVFTRPPPVQRQKTAEELAADEVERARREVVYAETQERADNGDVRAQFMMMLARVAREDQESRNAELSRALLNMHKFQREQMEKYKPKE